MHAYGGAGGDCACSSGNAGKEFRRTAHVDLGEQRQSVLAYDDEGGQQHGPTRWSSDRWVLTRFRTAMTVNLGEHRDGPIHARGAHVRARAMDRSRFTDAAADGGGHARHRHLDGPGARRLRTCTAAQAWWSWRAVTSTLTCRSSTCPARPPSSGSGCTWA